MVFNVVMPGIIFPQLGFELASHIIFTQVLFSVIFSLLFLDLEKHMCFRCCESPGKLTRVFDPDNPEKNFIMMAGQVVEVTDVDQGGQLEMIGLEGETRPGTVKSYSVVEIEERKDQQLLQ